MLIDWMRLDRVRLIVCEFAIPFCRPELIYFHTMQEITTYTQPTPGYGDTRCTPCIYELTAGLGACKTIAS